MTIESIRSLGCRVLTDEPMAKHTTFRIGGTVSRMIFPNSAEAMKSLIYAMREEEEKPVVIGRGSNLLPRDEHMHITVVCTTEIADEISISHDNPELIYASGGALLAKIAVFALENALTGFEFAHGIPGTLGGAVLINAGAYGGEMKHTVDSVHVLSEGKDYSASNSECDFSYRHSAFQNGEIILGAALKLTSGNAEDIRAAMADFTNRRRASQPLEYPSAGSAFKRPPGGYAAELIERCGLKGYTVGGAAVSEKHAGFIINLGGASSHDVHAVIGHVRETVFKQTGIELEPEIRFL